MKNNIKKFRKMAGLSQEKLADKVGTTLQQISRLERDERKLTPEWAEKIAKALNIEPYKLLPSDWQPTQTNDINKETLRLILKEIDSYLDQNDLEIIIDDKVKWITIVYERLQDIPAEQQKSQAEMMIDVLAQAANQ